jgi:hypothetical protein
MLPEIRQRLLALKNKRSLPAAGALRVMQQSVALRRAKEHQLHSDLLKR